MINDIWLWIAFNLVIFALIYFDLKLFHSKEHVISLKESLFWSCFWIGLALVFNIVIYFTRGPEPALNFLTAYLLEKSLSVDNLFVFLLIFSYFKVPGNLLHQVLFWGVLGAIIMRTIFIVAGIVIISHFAWLIYFFGAFLIYSGIKLGLEKDKEIHPENNFFLKLFKRFMPVTDHFEGKKFFVKKSGITYATPLFVVLIVIETTDVFFALDSIPAVLAITLDPFIVYTSNIFAILGLRALYFTLERMMQIFHHLHYGLAFILVFIGFKMLVHDYYQIPTFAALGVIALSLCLSIIASIRFPKRD